jgi:glycosyltransferase involved in cell wall biosynthesis
MTRLRVLWVIKSLSRGGAETMLVNHARRADLGSFDISLAYAVPERDELVPEFERCGVPTFCFDPQRRGPLAWGAQLARAVQRSEPDIVHINSPLVAGAARAALRLLPRRPALLYSEQGVWSQHHLATRLLNAATFRLNDHTIVVSDAVRRSVPAALLGPHTLVYNAVDTSAVAAAADRRSRAELGFGEEHIVLGSVSNQRPDKNHRLMLDAFSDARRTVPHLRLVLAGDGPLRQENERYARELGLGDDVRFLGSRPDVHRLLGGMDLFTLSSDGEGLPLALAEAMAAAVPPVATDAGGIPEMIRDGVDGYVVRRGDRTALAGHYVRLAQDPALRERLGAAARQSSRRFDATYASARIERIYVDLALEAGRAPIAALATRRRGVTT